MAINRYSRNIACIGAEGQRRLSAASVFVIGCGALGGQVAMLLAGAGVGRIGIADFDIVDISNLQRQLFFSEDSSGRKKVVEIASRMRSLNSDIIVEPFDKLIRESDCDELLGKYDFIVDATDNPATKYMTDRICRRIGVAGCIAGVSGWQGQVMTVTGKSDDGSLCFADIFPPPDSDPSMLPCEALGVIGASASAIASIQAAEALKYILGAGTPLVGRLLTMNLLDMTWQVYEMSPK